MDHKKYTDSLGTFEGHLKEIEDHHSIFTNRTRLLIVQAGLVDASTSRSSAALVGRERFRILD